jgi:sec-independent protein translocase protein TatC
MKNRHLEHFIELRKRITLLMLFFIFSFIFSYNYIEEIYDFILLPLSNLQSIDESKRIIYTNLTEAFTSYLKLSFFITLLCLFPYINWHIYRFVAPALYDKEKNIFNLLLLISPILFYLGAIFAYKLVLPLAFDFFMSFEQKSGNLPLILEAKISEYIKLSLRIILAFGFVFQVPVILVLLIKSNLLTLEDLRKNRKYAIVTFFIIGAVITPPDIISQIAIAIPMLILYELTLIIAKKL